MLKVIEIINEIANTSSRNDKEAILERNKDNELLKKVLKFVYDPFVLTGMSDKKIYKNINESAIITLNGIEGAMEYLQLHNSGRDLDLSLIHI